MNLLPGSSSCCDPCLSSVETTINLNDLTLGWFNVRTYGALGNGSTNDTAAFEAAYAAAVAVGGGIIYVPTGDYPMNLTILHRNIAIRGAGVTDVRTNITYGLRPWDTSRPVIQIGNDTGFVEGFSIRDIAIFGFRGSNACPGCLHFLGGAWGANAINVGMIGGARTAYFKTGVTYPSTLNTLIHCHLWEGTTATVEGDDVRTGSGFCTDNKLTSCYINGHNTLGYALKVARGSTLKLIGTYIDCAPMHGFYSFQGGSVRFSSSNLDNGDAAQNVAIIEWDSPNADHDVSRYLRGSVDVQGLIRWIDTLGTTDDTVPSGGISYFEDSSLYRKPFIVAPIKLCTVAGEFTNEYSLDLTNPDGALAFSKNSGVNTFEIQYLHDTVNLSVANGNTSSFLQYDFTGVTTSAAAFRLFRRTNSVGTLTFEIFRGNGSANRQHVLASFADSYVCALTGNFGVGTAAPTGRLHVVGLQTFANNAAALGGGLTAGAFYQVTGTDPRQVAVVF